MVQHLSQAEKGELDHYGTVFSWCMQLLVLLLIHNIILSVFEITLVRLSETSDYLFTRTSKQSFSSYPSAK